MLLRGSCGKSAAMKRDVALTKLYFEEKSNKLNLGLDIVNLEQSSILK